MPDRGVLLIFLTTSHSVGCLLVYNHATTRDDYRMATEMDPRHLVVYGESISVDWNYHMERCTYYSLGKFLPTYIGLLVCMIDITCRSGYQTAPSILTTKSACCR